MVQDSTSAEPATVTNGDWPLAVVRDVLVAVAAEVAIALPALCRPAVTLNAVEPPVNASLPFVVSIEAEMPYALIWLLSWSTSDWPDAPDAPPPTVAVT